MTASPALHWDQQRLAFKLPPLVLALGIAALIWLTPTWLPHTLEPSGRLWLGAALALLGGGVCMAGVLAFGRARTTVSPVAPQAASALVVRGVYRYSRNPMYLGFALGLLGWSIGLGKLSGVLWCAVFIAYLQRYQIKPEERVLGDKFGAAYQSYCAQVRRWV